MSRHTLDPGPVKEVKAPPIKCRDARNPIDPMTPLLRDQIECPNATDCMGRLGGTIVDIPCSLHASWLRKQGSVVDSERGFTALPALRRPTQYPIWLCLPPVPPAACNRDENTQQCQPEAPNPKREVEHR